MKTSPSQRALSTLLDAAKDKDPDALRRRKALLASGFDRTALWEYSTGRSSPTAARAGEIERDTDGAVLANGWIPDGETAS